MQRHQAHQLLRTLSLHRQDTDGANRPHHHRHRSHRGAHLDGQDPLRQAGLPLLTSSYYPYLLCHVVSISNASVDADAIVIELLNATPTEGVSHLAHSVLVVEEPVDVLLHHFLLLHLLEVVVDRAVGLALQSNATLHEEQVVECFGNGVAEDSSEPLEVDFELEVGLALKRVFCKALPKLLDGSHALLLFIFQTKQVSVHLPRQHYSLLVGLSVESQRPFQTALVLLPV